MTQAMTQGTTKARRLRELLRTERPVVSPGIYDGYGLLLVEAMGFKTAATSGSALSNSLILQPDIGLLSLRENVDQCRHFARSVSIPLMADADTGYGNAVSVYHVVQYFEEAGIVGINIEDQFSPKRCGHMRGKELIDAKEMAMKIESAVKAKKDPDFILNARTDAIAVEGIGMGFGVRARPTTPLFSLKKLKELGVARAAMPRLLSGSALMGMRKALEVLLDCMKTGEAADRPDLLVSMEELTSLVGYERISKLEQEMLTEEQLDKKYGTGERSYVYKTGTFDRSGD